MAETVTGDVVRLTEHNELVFWCPGCASMHVIPVGDSEGKWSWDLEKKTPTVHPSILIYGIEGHQPRCHFFIHKGQIQYLPDSEHELRGSTTPMVDLAVVR